MKTKDNFAPQELEALEELNAIKARHPNWITGKLKTKADGTLAYCFSVDPSAVKKINAGLNLSAVKDLCSMIDSFQRKILATAKLLGWPTSQADRLE